MIKVLHFITTIERGGAENHLQTLIEKQFLDNYELVIVYLKGSPYWKSYFEKKGVKVYKFKSIFNLISIIKKNRIEIIHAHLQLPEIICFLVKLLHPQIKLVITKHNDEFSKFLPRFLHKYFYKIISLKASKVICISENVKNFCTKHLKIDEEKLEVIYYGIDINKFSTDNISKPKIQLIKNEFNLKNQFIIGTVARLHPQKSLETLIFAFKKFLKKESNSSLFIVGEGPLKKKLINLCIDLEISNKVIFAGKREDIPEIYQCIDIFVLSSIYEGLGLVLLEAMASKIPIIGTDAGAIPDIIKNCGTVVPVKNDKKLFDALLKIKNDDVLKEKMINNGLKEIHVRFSLERMFKQTEEVYLM